MINILDFHSQTLRLFASVFSPLLIALWHFPRKSHSGHTAHDWLTKLHLLLYSRLLLTSQTCPDCTNIFLFVLRLCVHDFQTKRLLSAIWNEINEGMKTTYAHHQLTNLTNEIGEKKTNKQNQDEKKVIVVNQRTLCIYANYRLNELSQIKPLECN